MHPRELMTGKVLGIGLVGLGMMAVTVGAALIANAFVKSAAIPPELGSRLPQVLLWFVLGFTLYAFAFAAAGAMVARQEEVQSVAMPLAAVIVVALLLVYATLASPDSAWIRLLSFLPPLAPMLMPARSFLGTAQGWEVALAIGIELLAIVGTVTLAARIYRRALLTGGARLTWGQAIRLGRGARPDLIRISAFSCADSGQLGYRGVGVPLPALVVLVIAVAGMVYEPSPAGA